MCLDTGSRIYSMDLPQGGLEIPCIFTFSGESLKFQKAKSLIEDLKNIYIYDDKGVRSGWWNEKGARSGWWNEKGARSGWWREGSKIRMVE